MKQTLSLSRILAVSCMLFSIFFGAGNMVFPPQLGQMAGTQSFVAWLGFIVTGVGVAILGVIAVVWAGESLDDISQKAGKRLGLWLTGAVYLLIGPLFALPRTGSVSFELGIVPFVSGEAGLLHSGIFTVIFFGLTLFVCLYPQKIVDILGKILTPILLLAIAVIFIAAVMNPVGEAVAPTGDYASIPFFKGLVEGYLTLDGFAGLVFSITVAQSLRLYGITEHKPLLKYTLLTACTAGAIMAAIYAALCYVGMQTSGMEAFANGGALLAWSTDTLLGKAGSVALSVAVILACFTTAVGLTTSVSRYFSEKLPQVPYKNWVIVNVLFSIVMANLGIGLLVKIILPLLVLFYPVVTVMVVLSLFDRFYKNRPEVYILGMLGAFCVSLFDGLKTAGILLGGVTTTVLETVPFGTLGIGWIVPALLGIVLGISPLGKALAKPFQKSTSH